MPHVDPTHLVELALGADVSDNDVGALRHIAACERCWEELNLMTRVVIAARGVEEPDLPAAPPERVWQRIMEELGEGEEPAAPRATSLRRVPAADPHRTSRSPDTQHRRARLALGLLTGVVVVWWWGRNRSRRPSACDD